MNPLTISKNYTSSNNLSTLKDKGFECINVEHIISKNSKITARISTNGIVKFCNDDFLASFGISKKENFNSTKHSDMPNLISKIIDYNIENKINSTFFIKNRSVNGKFFWTLSNFNPNKSADINIAYTLTCKKAHAESVYQINKLYTILNEIENSCGEQTALKYFIGFLEDKKMSFSNYNLKLASI